VPIGTIAMWGGSFKNFPSNWLLCYGQEVSRFTYALLFNRIGETWGPGDGQTSFHLPPGGVFFINAAGLTIDYRVPLNVLPAAPGQTPIVSSPEGVAARGGSQTSGLLLASDIPSIMVQLMFQIQNFANASPSNPGTPIANVQPAGASFWTAQVDELLCDMSNVHLGGTNQKAFSIMPPFVGINYMIKWQ
jgi:microcystin-dependent protein